jgi:hypothetical protein
MGWRNNNRENKKNRKKKMIEWDVGGILNIWL